MCFDMKNILKSNRNYISKQSLRTRINGEKAGLKFQFILILFIKNN
jgi:hypothetical protein